MTDSISFADFIITPVFLIIFFFFATFIKQRNIDKNPAYRYYTTGLFVKLFGAIAICLSYIFYFSGGDTIGYHHDCTTISKCFLRSPYQMLRLTFLGVDTESFMAFDYSTSYPYYAYDF